MEMSPSATDQSLREVLEEVREILERPAHKSAAGSPRRGRGPQKEEGTTTHSRQSSFQKIREMFGGPPKQKKNTGRE